MERTAASVRTLTELCVSKFEDLISIRSSRRVELETRLADFNLWADGVGALSKPQSSLDSRLRSRAKDLALVKNILIMLIDSLDYYADLTEADVNSDGDIGNLDSAIGNLALIGAAIRRTGKASRSRRADRTFNPDEYQDFKKHLECIVALRPTQEPLFHETENGHYIAKFTTAKLSPLQKRLIDANLRRRHNFSVAQKHSRSQNDMQTQLPPLVVRSSTRNPLQTGPPTIVQNKAEPYWQRPHQATKDTEREAPTISEFSRASTAEGTLQYAPDSYDPGVAKTQITAIASDIEFPQAPSILPGRQVSKCPCCCQSLPSAVLSYPKAWKQHVIEDLCPYTCIADNCPMPNLLFTTRSKWEAHFRNNHPPRWECPFCEEQRTDYLTMESMGSHLQNDHKDEVQENSLETLLSWSAVQKIGIKSCPLCSSHGPEDSPELVDHVLSHIYEFALRALPWPSSIVQDLNVPPGSFNLPENPEHAQRLQHWINETPCETEGRLMLELCNYDQADHSAPTPANPVEYSDYFLTNQYFDDRLGDNSASPQGSRSTIWSDTTNSDSSVEIVTITSATLSTDGWLLVSASPNGDIELWDITRNAKMKILGSHGDGQVISMVLSPSNLLLVSLSDDGTVRVWDMATDAPKMDIKGFNGQVNSVAFSPDGRLLAAGLQDWTVGLWALETGNYRSLAPLAHGSHVGSVAFSPDGKLLASASEDGTIMLWNIRTRTRQMVFKGHTGRINSIDFSFSQTGGLLLASTSQDNTIRIWSVATGGLLTTLRIHKSQALSAVFSPGGSVLASTLQDRTIQLFDVTTGAWVKTFQGHNSQIKALSFLPSSEFLTSISQDGTVKLWNINSDKLPRTLILGNQTPWKQTQSLGGQAQLAEHPLAVAAMAKLSSKYKALGRWEEVESLFQRMIETKKVLLGPSHFDTLASMASLASIFKNEEKLDEAETLLNEVMMVTNGELGSAHPNSLISKFDLALVYAAQGRLEEAEFLLVSVVNGRKMVLGPEHRDSLTSMASLASIYKGQQRFQAAESLLVQVVDTRKKVLGQSHPDSLASIVDLASIYECQGRLKEAELLLMPVVDVRKKVLGLEHPDSLTSMANLALIYKGQGRLKEAESLFSQVVDTRKKVLGQSHPDSLASIVNLASIYEGQGRLKQAESLLVQVVDTRKEVLGRGHSDTLTSMVNLASIYTGQGRFQEAESLLAQVIKTEKLAPDPENTHTLKNIANIANLASLYKDQGRLEEAESLFVEVVDVRKRILGLDHPDTLISMADLSSTATEKLLRGL
ncbi:hypothetical protein F4861DRAFT_62973 [Xylaria intraflava]|nr:hypothetical protein F4861DRAFT_62973 [Xylaria intraflava]